MATPIDNADKKTFLQWVLGKGKLTSFITLLALLQYVAVIVGNNYNLLHENIDLTTHVFLSCFSQLFFIVVWFKMYQWYRDDIEGRTR